MDLSEQVRIVNGDAQRELDSKRFQILHDIDQRGRDRQTRRDVLAGMVEDDGSGLPPTIRALSKAELKTPFLAHALKAQMGGTNEDFGCMREVSNGLRKDFSNLPDHGGYLVPMVVRASGLHTKENSAGDYLVGTPVLDLITVERNRCVAMKIGATVVSLKSGAVMPRQKAGGVASFVSENPGQDIAPTDSSLGAISLQPHTLMATTSFSRQVSQQSSPDLHAIMGTDLGEAHASAIDQAAFAGTGVSGQPVGLTRTADIPVISLGTDGLAPTGAALCSMEQAVADASADLGTLAWVTTPGMRARLRQTPIFTNASVPCWSGVEGADRLLNSPAAVSRSIPQGLTKGANNDCHCIIVGYWPALVIAHFGVMELTFDPLAQKRRNMIEVSSYQMVDIGVRRPSAFALILDARNV